MTFSKDIIDGIRNAITTDNILCLLEELGAQPRYHNGDVIISKTICHDGDSHKLYYYINSHNFHCYTNCGSFDIFDLIKKVFNIDFIQAIYYIINKFNLRYLLDTEENIDCNTTRKFEEEYFKIHRKIFNKEKEFQIQSIELPEYNSDILFRFSYPIIKSWEREGISREVIQQARIGYYPGGSQITIPHYDKKGRLIGIRGRQLGSEEAELFGKYRPLFINGQYYSHPLAFNLYNLNNSKDNIKKFGKSIVFEGEKSPLLYRSYFGIDNDISCASCGSSLSEYQVRLLIESGAKEICVAFDRQFQSIGDKEFKKLTNSLTELNKKYSKFITFSFLFDKNMITDYKDAPIDKGANVFLQLFKERIIL